MSTIDRNSVVTGEAPLRRALALPTLVVAVLSMIVGWLVLLQQIDDANQYIGLTVLELLAGSVLLQGSVILALGVASYVGAIRSTPDATAGTFTGSVVGLVWGVAVTAIVTVHLGVSLVYWIAGLPVPAGLLIGAVGGIVAFLATVLPREDVGVTIPLGLFLAPIGLAMLVGPLATPWTWDPGWTDAVFPGSEVLPFVVIVGSLLACWTLAKIEVGFGATGRERGAFYLIGLSIGGMLGVLGLLIYFIVRKGADTLLTNAAFQGFDGRLVLPYVPFDLPWVDVSLPFLLNVPGSLFVDVPGVWPAVVGTVWLVIGAVVIAVPMGIGAAVFLTEYVERGRITQIVEVVTNGLWSTPSIVFGLFGMAFLLPRLSNGSRSMIAGQVVLAFMLLPLVVITTRESILAVPDEYRDASAALGVSRWKTVRSVVLPAAMPGVITGVILGVGRIAGETAPLLLVFGGSPYPDQDWQIMEAWQFSLQPPFVSNPELTRRGTALPFQLYTSITSGNVPGETFTNTEFGWGTALVLLLVVMVFYAIGVASRLYFQRKLNYE